MTILNVVVSLDVAGQLATIACENCFPHDDNCAADVSLKINTNDDAEIIITLSREQCKDIKQQLEKFT